MPEPLRIPRINNNDDTVRIAAVLVQPGALLRAGEAAIEIESDKAVIAVEAEADGYVLALRVSEGETVAVGSIALWLGATADEAVPEEGAAGAAPAIAGEAGPTAKARLLLARHGLMVSDVVFSGPRLTAADVEAHLAAAGREPDLATAPRAAPRNSAPARVQLPAPAREAPASPARRGMIASVTWQREHAAATYLELPFDAEAWEAHAAAYARQQRSLLSPLLPLMAHRLVRLAAEMPEINATVIEGPDGPRDALYERVNLGFTVQAGETLYLVVVHGAEALDEAAFVHRLGDLQRRAMARKLEASELQGATLGFSSMARWEVSRHIPILAPWTALMVSHTVQRLEGRRQGVLGITYDHRVLSGFAAARVLRTLAVPPAASAGLLRDASEG
jgi:pyruvate dehydrogenase E2 component (dihydrolipoamide acetyltransferase)